MRIGVFKSGIHLALTAIIAVCGANEVAATPLQLDRLAFEQIHHSTERRAWLGRMAPPMTGGRDAWRLARLGPLASGWDEPMKADDEIPLVRIRPSTRASKRWVRSIDAAIFVATPGGRPIADTYDFAGMDRKRFAPIMPVKIKRMPVESTRIPVEKKRMARRRKPEPTSRLKPPPRQPNEVLDLSVRTLDYVVLTTKIFVENLSRILKIFL